MNKTAARVAATITTVSSLSSPNCGFEYPKTRDKMWFKKNDTRDTLNHMSRLKTFILRNKKLKPKTGRFRLIKSRLEIKKSRSLQTNLFVLSISQWEKSLENLEGFLFVTSFFLPAFVFLSFFFPRLIQFLDIGSIGITTIKEFYPKVVEYNCVPLRKSSIDPRAERWELRFIWNK